MTIKNLHIILIAIFISNQLSAQIEKGTIRIGPNISLANQSQPIDPNNSFNSINLQFGSTGGYYFLTNLELGVAFDLLVTNVSRAGTTQSSSFGITVGPMLTYMTPLQENLYLPLSVGYGLSRLTSSDNFGDTSFGGREFSLGAGIAYVLQNKLGARVSFGFESVRLTDNNSSNNTSTAINANRITADAGFNFYF